MRFAATALATTGLLATSALAAPTSITKRQDSSGQVVVYWGQNGGGIVENNDLSAYCTSTTGIDILVLAFLYQFGQGEDIANGEIGQSCYISESGEGQQCSDLATAIQTCQSAGVKVILSLGGAVGNYGLSSQQEAQTVGQNLWDAYANPSLSSNSSIPRPFGDVSVDGWDFDIEHNNVGDNSNYQYLISTLRGNFASDTSKTYYITGAPQCPLPEPNMSVIIGSSQFDYLWIQFYNNPGCSVNGNINYADWKANITGTPSANAKLFIGIPASPDGATGTSSGAQYYLPPANLTSLVSQYDTDSAFGGVMMWNAGFSDSNVNNGCTYAQEASNILQTGSAC